MALTLTPEEETLILERRKQAIWNDAYNRGLHAAAQLTEAWANESCGGSGSGGDGYRNLAKTILTLQLK